MVSNPGYFSQMATGGSLTQIEDGVDNPHTGLIKALSLGVTGNYVISGFDASSVTATSATIAAGVVLRDGERVAITGSSVSLSSTYTTGYHMLVARSSALAVINPTAADKVPAFTAGDVPIAILAHTGSNPMQIQYFGTGKTENSISIARDNSGYTEEGTIKAASGGGIDIITTQTDEDIRITPNGNGKIVLDGLNFPTSDGSNGDLLQTNGSNDLSFVSKSSLSFSNHLTVSGNFSDVADKSAAYKRLVGNATLTALGSSVATDDEVLIRDISETNVEVKPKTVTVQNILDLVDEVADADGDTKIQVEETSDEDKIRFDTAGSERMIIDDSGNVGIGTDSPDKLLHLSATTDATLRIESTKTSVAANDVIGAIEWEGQDSSTGSAGVGAKIDVINENATPDFAMRFFTQKAVSGTPTFSEKMRITSDGKVAIGNTSPSVELDVTGQFRLSSHAELNGDLNHDGSNIGFFGTAVAAQQSVGNLASNTIGALPFDPTATQLFSPQQQVYLQSLENEISGLRTKVDALVDALQLYGLIT